MPAACTQCVSTLLLAAGALPTKMAYSLSRAASGILRVDYAVTSVIINPATLQIIILNHLKMEVQSIVMPKPPVPPAVALPPIPGMPPIPPLAAGSLPMSAM